MSHRTKKSLLLSVVMVFALVVALGGSAYSQNSATATANATATIVTPIAMTKTADMAFAEVAAGSTAGTIVLATDGSRTATGGTKVGGGTGVAASFTVTGQSGYTYNITLPGSASTLSDGASHTMTVNTWTSNPTPSGTLTGGTSTLKVGGTLNVGASQVAGTYTGTFSVTVAYP